MHTMHQIPALMTALQSLQSGIPTFAKLYSENTIDGVLYFW